MSRWPITGYSGRILIAIQQSGVRNNVVTLKGFPSMGAVIFVDNFSCLIHQYSKIQ
jgi:hypothetical protein